MSDFLDRLASRAIGHEPMLEPRLPSLFEPVQRAPALLPTVDETGAREKRRDSATSGEPPASSASAASMVPPAPIEPVPRVTARRDATSAAPQASGEPPVATARFVATATPPSPRTADEHPTVAATVPLPRPHVVPAPVQLRERHATPLPAAVAEPARAAVGVLLPPPPSGITASRASESVASLPRAANNRAGHAGSDSRRSLPAEPVVHVSIGRIEVRAAPAVTAAPRVRDAARPGSLDDYLRQRNGKAPS